MRPRGSNLILVLLGLLVGALCAPLTNLFQSYQAQSGVIMTNETFVAILLFIGAIIAAVLYVLDRTNRRLADALPPQLLPLISIALDALATLAKQTETPLDDEIVQRIIDALKSPEAQSKLLQRVPKVTAQAAPAVYEPVMHVPPDEAAG